MSLCTDIRIAIIETGDPPRLAAVVTPIRDGEDMLPPSEPIILVPGMSLVYGPVGLEYTVQSELRVYGGDAPPPPPPPAPPPAAPPARPAVRPGQAQLNKGS